MTAVADSEPGAGAGFGLSTRPATRDDLPAVLDTEHHSFSTPWSRRAFEALLGRETVSFQVLEAGGEVAGHGVLWWVGPEAEVANLAVAPAFRGRRGGALLLDALLATASVRGVSKVFLEVRESNGPAISLYQGRGFIAVGRRPQYYRKPPEDAVIMALDLGAATDPASSGRAHSTGAADRAHAAAADDPARTSGPADHPRPNPG